MKVKFTKRWSARQGQTAEVTDAAGERLISQGLAEKVAARKAATGSAEETVDGDGGEAKAKTSSRKSSRKG